MDKEQRNKQPPVPDNLEQLLTDKQRAALQMIQALGWQLKFVRRPAFLEPEPVVYNAKLDQIGVLDTDGNINLELALNIRPDEPGQEEAPPVETVSPQERRKGMPPIPDNLDSLLNTIQLRAMRHIETFGWQALFVRRQLFQEPVVGIINPEGDKVATLEQDGRINLLPETAIRTQDSRQQSGETESAALGQSAQKLPPR